MAADLERLLNHREVHMTMMFAVRCLLISLLGIRVFVVVVVVVVAVFRDVLRSPSIQGLRASILSSALKDVKKKKKAYGKATQQCHHPAAVIKIDPRAAFFVLSVHKCFIPALQSAPPALCGQRPLARTTSFTIRYSIPIYLTV